MSDTARLTQIWRYPVKSMDGEQIANARLTPRGIDGDRAWALMDRTAHAVGSAKSARRFGELLRWTARFQGEPGTDPPPAVSMTSPDGGETLRSDQPDLDARLSARFGGNVTLVHRAPEGLKLLIGAGALGGKHAETAELPVSSGSPAGTLFNYAAIHIVTVQTLERLQSDYPTGRMAVERFRPNLVVDVPGTDGFVENAWPGRTLKIGDTLTLKVSIPCPRCVVTTLERRDVAHDPGVLKQLVQSNSVDLGDFGSLPCVGIYADVITPGEVRQGDAIRIIETS